MVEKDDDKLWQHVIQGVKPIEKEELADKSEARKIQNPKHEIQKCHVERAGKIATKQPKSTDITSPDSIDRKNWQRFSRGKMEIEGRLDLHGYNQDQALNAVKRFIERHIGKGSRCVIIVTGKGRKNPDDMEPKFKPIAGVLRQRLPEWLAMPMFRDSILKITPAQPKDGGQGAFYILLKRRR